MEGTMKDQELARLVAEHHYRIPLRLLRTKGTMIAYEFPAGFENLLSETTKHTSTQLTSLRRQVLARHGGWGHPEALDQDQETGRVILWVQGHPKRKVPGAEVPVTVKLGDTPNSPNYNYRVEYLFRTGNEPVLDEPRIGTFRQQAGAVERKARDTEKAARASRNERTIYKRSKRLSENDAAYRAVVDQREAYEAELNGTPAQPARARVTGRSNPRGRKRAPRKNWY